MDRHAITWTNVDNWTPSNKSQWTFIQIIMIFIQQNAFENVFKMLPKQPGPIAVILILIFCLVLKFHHENHSPTCSKKGNVLTLSETWTEIPYSSNVIIWNKNVSQVPMKPQPSIKITTNHRLFPFMKTSLYKNKIKATSFSGIILCMRPANERRRYNVTSSLIDWAHNEGKNLEQFYEKSKRLSGTINQWSLPTSPSLTQPFQGWPADKNMVIGQWWPF